MNLNLNKFDKIFVIITAIVFLLSLALFKLSSISTEYIVNLQNTLLKQAIVQTRNMTTMQSITAVLTPFASVFIALVLLCLGFSLLSSYGYFKNNNKAGLLAVLPTVLVFFIFGITYMSLFIFISLLISGWYVVSSSNAYGKELKKWIYFRVGSNAVSKALLVLNILIAFGLFVSVSSNLAFYTESFSKEMADILVEISVNSVPENMRGLMTTEVQDRVSSMMQELPVIKAYFRWLPIITAIMVWAVLEFLRSIIFSNISGIFTTILIRVNAKTKISKL